MSSTPNSQEDFEDEEREALRELGLLTRKTEKTRTAPPCELTPEEEYEAAVKNTRQRKSGPASSWYRTTRS